MKSGPPKRLTREESRDQTRARLLEAAAVVLQSKGLAAASVEDIVAEAGFSRGAFYSNFEDKGQLLLALLAREQDRMTQELREIFDADMPISDFSQAVLAYYRNLRHNDIGFLAGMEAKLLAIRDPGFRRLLSDLMRVKYTMIAGFVATFRERTGAPANVPAEHLATGFVAFCDGVQFSHLADPEFFDNTMVDAVLTHYFEATVFHANKSSAVIP